MSIAVTYKTRVQVIRVKRVVGRASWQQYIAY